MHIFWKVLEFIGNVAIYIWKFTVKHKLQVGLPFAFIFWLITENKNVELRSLAFFLDDPYSTFYCQTSTVGECENYIDRLNAEASGLQVSILFSTIGMLIGIFLILWFLFDWFRSKNEKVESGKFKKCFYCAEKILVEAKVCKHCGRDLPQST